MGHAAVVVAAAGVVGRALQAGQVERALAAIVVLEAVLVVVARAVRRGQ